MPIILLGRHQYLEVAIPPQPPQHYVATTQSAQRGYCGVAECAHTEVGGVGRLCANEWGNSPRPPLTQMNCESLVYTGNTQWASMAAWATMSGLSGGLGGGGLQEGRQLRPKDWVGWKVGIVGGGGALWHTEPGTEASTDGR